MSYERIVNYKILPTEPFKMVRGCGGCGCKKIFSCKGKFRVNANGRRLDVWLIYGCEDCDHTYNLSVYERISPEKILEKEYKLFLQNDKELVLKIGTDKALFQRNKAEIDWQSLEYRLERISENDAALSQDKDEMLETLRAGHQVSVCLQNPCKISVREDKLAAEIFQLSRSKAKKLLESGRITIYTMGDKKMDEILAYHVVTEKPMKLGQNLLFDEKHHNGVWERVQKHNNIVKAIYENPENFAEKELEYPVQVALRELALEEVRREKFQEYPSRMACLYVSEELATAQMWAQYFIKLKRPTFQIVKLRIKGKCFTGDANNCFDGSVWKEKNLAQAEHYWCNLPNVDGERPIPEMLVAGEMEVVEIVEEYM